MIRSIAHFVLLLSAATVVAHGADSTQFEKVRAQMRAQMETIGPDGKPKVSKQFRRWEWFWQSRLMPDGSFPTAQMYVDEYRTLTSQKRSENAQAAKQWKELGPIAPDLPGLSSSWNGIGRVNVIEFSRANTSVFWAGSASGGLWKTTNSGQAWTYVPIQVGPVIGVSDIAIAQSDERVMYVATGDADGATPNNPLGFPSFTYGVVKSTDGGVTWTETGFTADVSSQTVVSRLWVHPTDPNIVVTAGYSGIRRTTDGGVSWRQTTSGLYRDLIGHPTNPNILYAASYAPGGGAAILRSTDNGVTWETQFDAPLANRIRLAVSKANPNVVAAVASEYQYNGLEGVYKSTDAGESFARLSTSLNLLHWNANGNGRGGQGFYDLAMEISPLNANHLFVGGINAWRTTTNGQTWILSAHWTGDGAPWVHADHHFFKFHPVTNVLYATHDGGIARSTDQGISWRDISNGLKIQQYYGLSTSNTNTSITLAGSQDNGTALSRNNGSSFTHTLDGDGMMSAIDYVNPMIMYGSQYEGTFFRTTNQGANWIFSSSRAQRGESMASWVAPVAADPVQNNVAYIGYGQVYKTTTGGANWTRISQIQTSTPSRWIAVAPSDPTHLYVAYYSTLMFSTNGGTNWQAGPNISGVIMNIEVHPTDPKRYYVSVGGFTSGYKVLEVANNQVTNITGTGLPNVPCNSVIYQRGTPNRLFAGTDLGVFVTDIGSGFWEPYGTGMPAVIVSAMRLVPATGILRVSTYGRGIWEIDVKQCTATKPTIATVGATTFCFGDSVVLTAADGYASYRWSNGETTRSTVIKGPIGAATYTVSVEDNAGCRALSDAVSITIQQAPSKPTINQRGPDTLRSSAVGGITVFQWFRDGVAIPGATSRELVTQTSGTYTVSVQGSNGCRSRSNEFVFEYSPVSVDEIVESGNVVVTPNPAAESILVRMPLAPERTVEIVTVRGDVLLRETVANGSLEQRLDISALASGAYIVRVTAGSATWIERFVRQ